MTTRGNKNTRLCDASTKGAAACDDKAYKVVDLFAGAGGLSLGAARAGFDMAAAVEWEEHAAETHRSNFPHTVVFEDDIMNLDLASSLAAEAISADDIIGIIGGPPCQGFSNIGKGNAADPRNLLFVRFFQIVADVQPCFFLAENVPGILNDKYQHVREKARKLVEKHYQITGPLVLAASDYGAPTSRTRVFFIGIRSDLDITLQTQDFIDAQARNRTSVGQALDGLPSDVSSNSGGFLPLTSEYSSGNTSQCKFYRDRISGLIPDGVGNKEYIELFQKRNLVNGCHETHHKEHVVSRFSALKQGQYDSVSRARRLDLDGFCPTLRAGTGPDKGSFQALRPIHPTEPRVITPREAARLQGFPDWFKLPDTIWHGFRQIGNSVSPFVAEALLTVVHQKLTE